MALSGDEMTEKSSGASKNAILASRPPGMAGTTIAGLAEGQGQRKLANGETLSCTHQEKLCIRK